MGESMMPRGAGQRTGQDSGQETEKVWSAIERLKVCMLVDHDRAALRARPMQALPDPKTGVVWFVTDRRCHQSGEIADDPGVCLAFADGARQFYLSVSGTAEVVDDRAQLRTLWSDEIDAWFPEGPDDENAVLLRVAPGQAEFWDGVTERETIAMDPAGPRGDRPRPESGEHARLAF